MANQTQTPRKCFTWKIFIYRTTGAILSLLLAHSYFTNPKFWENREHLLSAFVGALIWMLFKAGKVKEKKDEKSN